MDIRLDILSKSVNCRVNDMDPRVLSERVLTSAFHAPSAIKYAECARPKIRRKEELKECVPILQNSCDHSEVVVAKTVRTPMYLANVLLDLVPDLKIIYSTRDPRAVLNSRGKEQRYDEDKMVENVHNLCLRMKEDYRLFEKTLTKYPNRLLHVRYENIAQDPIAETQAMYKFIGRKMPASIRLWIINNTKVTTAGRPHSTNRNSTETSIKWKKELSPSLISRMTHTCEETLNIFGYS